MTCFLRRIYHRRWIFSCFGVAQHPDSPVPFAWVIRDCIQQDALLCQGGEPEGSRGVWAFLQRRPREAFLRPPRDWPWQLWRCLLCTAKLHTRTATHKRNALKAACEQTIQRKKSEKGSNLFLINTDSTQYNGRVETVSCWSRVFYVFDYSLCCFLWMIQLLRSYRIYLPNQS